MFPELCRRILHLCPAKVCKRSKVLAPSRNTANNEGWRTFLNYVNESYIYVRLEFARRFKVLEPSWNTANNEGWRTFPNYVGGSYIYVQLELQVV